MPGTRPPHVAPDPAEDQPLGLAKWQSAKSGDASAREWVVLRTEVVGTAYLRGKGVPSGDLPEALQDMHLGVARCLSDEAHRVNRDLEFFLKGRAHGAFSTWLKRKTLQATGEDFPAKPATAVGPVDADPSPIQIVVRREVVAAIRACREERLSPIEERAIRDRYDLGLGFEEIAKREGTRLETIRLRVFHAHKKLEPCLERRLKLREE